MKEKTFFGLPLTEVADPRFPGELFVIEGPDGSGRSTQIDALCAWLEANGHAVRVSGLRRSNLVSKQLERAKRGNILTRTTLSLFYATDFYDQLINEIVPALRAGHIVLADRYIYTLIARDSVRGAKHGWLRNLYGQAVVPDLVVYLKVSPRQLLERNLRKKASLDYWESGMDLALSRDIFDSFNQYQERMRHEFRKLRSEYGFEEIDADQDPETIQRELRAKIGRLLLTPANPDLPTAAKLDGGGQAAG